MRGCGNDAEADILSAEPRVQCAFKDSMIHIICNSHYVSHFAAFFIVAGAKISVVESCLRFVSRGRLSPDPHSSSERRLCWCLVELVFPTGEEGRPHPTPGGHRDPLPRPARPEPPATSVHLGPPGSARPSIRVHRRGPPTSGTCAPARASSEGPDRRGTVGSQTGMI